MKRAAGVELVLLGKGGIAGRMITFISFEAAVQPLDLCFVVFYINQTDSTGTCYLEILRMNIVPCAAE